MSDSKSGQRRNLISASLTQTSVPVNILTHGSALTSMQKCRTEITYVAPPYGVALRNGDAFMH